MSRTESDTVFRNFSSFQGSALVSRFISFLILSIRGISELTGLLILPLLGFIGNTAAAFTFRRIPNRTRVDYKPGENLLVILRRFLKDPETRPVLLARWIVLGQIILFGMALPFLRRSANFNAGQTFIYAIAIGLGAYTASLTFRPVEARAGSRPLLFFTSIPIALFLLAWTVIPNRFNIEIYAAIGFITMFFLTATNLAAGRLVVRITPDDGAVGFNSMETFVTSIVAIALGFSAGALADVSLRISDIVPINDFGLVFLLAALGSFVQLRLSYRMQEPGSLSLKETIKLLSNLDNMRTWQTVASLESTADPVRRKTLVHSVGHSHAPIASSEISRILSEPLSQEKGALIDALFLTKRPELVDFLCEEAVEPTAFHRERAIFALGAYPGEKTEKALESLLNDPDPRIRAATAKSLGRIGSKTQLQLVKSMSEQAINLHERLDYMIALFYMDDNREYLKDVFSKRTADRGERMERSLFTLISNQFGMSPSLGVLYREEVSKTGSGLDLLLEEARDTSFLLYNGTSISVLWSEKLYDRIWKLSVSALNNAPVPEELVPLAEALRDFPVESADKANALAVLFFTYQILTSEAEL